MKRIPRAEASRRLFVERSRYRRLALAPDDAATGSRVGGAPPLCLAADPPRCPRCGRALDYFLTIEGDLVGPAVARGGALSLFACAEVGCRYGSMAIDAEPPSVAAIPHAASPRAVGGDGRRLVRGHLRPETPSPRGDSEVEGSKLGGRASWVQTSIADDERDAAARGLSFLLQIDEQDVGEHTTSLGFGGGVVYVFATKDPTTGLPTLEGARVCWSHT